MSGGSMNYVCCQIEEECVGRMGDHEIDDLMKDVAKLVHDREWHLSGDTCEETYKEAVLKFKQKWFKTPRAVRLRGYVDYMLSSVRDECFSLIGEVEIENAPTLERLVNKYGEYVKKPTAAQIIGVTRETIYNMIGDGRLQVDSSGKLISMRSIVAHMASRKGVFKYDRVLDSL